MKIERFGPNCASLLALISNAELAEVLKEYNDWRRGNIDMVQPDPTVVGVAIDEAIKRLQKT